MTAKIIYEDQDLLIIDKPSGMTVNRSDTTIYEETIQDWAEGYLRVPGVSGGSKKASDTSDTFDTLDTFFKRGGIVHRLDKETSGILLIAKNPVAFSHLQAQFKERTVKKNYLALAHGRLRPAEGEIRLPVGRLPWNRKQFGIIVGGREAVTKYKIVGYYDTKIRGDEKLTLVELYPETGRTHQIRVHLKYIGHPIFADFLYAGRKTARDDRKILSRVFLHASKISLIHPTTGETLTFESPLPEELQEFLNGLEKVE